MRLAIPIMGLVMVATAALVLGGHKGGDIDLKRVLQTLNAPQPTNTIDVGPTGEPSVVIEHTGTQRPSVCSTPPPWNSFEVAMQCYQYWPSTPVVGCYPPENSGESTRAVWEQWFCSGYLVIPPTLTPAPPEGGYPYPVSTGTPSGYP